VSEAGRGPEIVRESDDEPRVLVVDDDEGFRRGLPVALGRAGMRAIGVDGGAAGLSVLERDPIDVVLTDVQMPEMSGPQLLERIKAAGYPVEVIMMTAFADITTAVNAVKAGAYAFLTKPFVSNEAVVLEVRKAAQHLRLNAKMRRLERELSARGGADELIGGSPSMRELDRRISGVAPVDSTVLILGESGTGKELVARAIHRRSRRASGSLVTVNCGAMPKDLVESELFGHVRGAFTNALQARAGLFEAADGGTLFLDEVGDLPMNAQVKLLRALQEGEIKPVGSDVTKTVDVRVVAATNVDLKSAVAAGTFRQDLFYRLNVIALRVPPLRERGDDVHVLAHHFVRSIAERAGRPPPRLSAEAAACVERYSWPGNVRELEHAMEHAVIFSEGETIALSALPAETRGEGAAASEPAVTSVGPKASVMLDLITALGLQEMGYADAKKRILTDFNEAYVAALLDSAKGNVSEAARRSKLDRSNFRRLFKDRGGESSRRGSSD
jgi:two-component system response regulator HydG